MMNLIHEQVIHRQFGIGSVIEQTEKIITVRFSDEYGVKLFEFPMAFDKFLVFGDAGLQEKVQEAVCLMTEQLETERKRKEEEYQKRKENERLANLAMKPASKRASAKKGAPKHFDAIKASAASCASV